MSIHIRSMDQAEAIKTVKRKITDIDGMKIDAQKRAVREGFDMDIVPTDIATYAVEAKNILRDLQSRNERMFLVTFLVVNMADSKRKLDNDIARATSVAQQYNWHLPCGTVCGHRENAALRRPHPLCGYQYDLLAGALLRLCQTTLSIKMEDNLWQQLTRSVRIS